ncbi:S8 family serine peptidase [Gorillibacterium sp. sgz500922]|uniref:S8 family serine peptidase n=1 Tax=Gorillibacterium sp. sgz500922 TaxID=3446694 RepID=UPI003F67D201
MGDKHVVVIDDGINEGYYQCGDLLYNMEVGPDGTMFTRTGYDPYRISHGTTCAGIIRKYAPGVVLSSVKIISDDRSTTSKKHLLQALTWCLSIPADLIHMSLGTRCFADFDGIAGIIGKLAERGTLLVAACDNLNRVSCPASLNTVIGVKCDEEGLLQDGQHLFHSKPYDGIEITARSGHSLVNFRGETSVTSVCNSYAAPYVSALLCRFMQNSPMLSLEKARRLLEGAGLRQSGRVSPVPVDAPPLSVPILGVLGEAEAAHLWGMRLGRLFREDGYYSVVVSASALVDDPCGGIVSLPYHQAEEDYLLQAVVAAYDPDLILLCLGEGTHERDFAREAEERYGIDIKIAIHPGNGRTAEPTSMDGPGRSLAGAGGSPTTKDGGCLSLEGAMPMEPSGPPLLDDAALSRLYKAIVERLEAAEADEGPGTPLVQVWPQPI